MLAKIATVEWSLKKIEKIFAKEFAFPKRFEMFAKVITMLSR